MKLSRIGFNPPERTYHRAHLQTGFTLIELMIVLAIVAILAAVGGIALNSQMPKYRLKGDSRSIASSLMLARMKAIASGLQHAIQFDLDASPKEYRLQRGNSNTGSTTWTDDPAYIREMSYGVSIDKVEDDGGEQNTGLAQIIFNPTGSSGTGKVYLGTDAANGYLVRLTPTTGRIENKKGW